MPPRDGTYIPTLAVRASEMNGMEFLPGASKDRMIPIFLLAPWSSSKSLARTMERIEIAFLRRHFFLDFDRDYIPGNSESPAQLEWLELRNPTNCFEAWRNFLIEHPMVIPCLQLEGLDESDIRQQIEYIQEMGREYCLRIELKRMPMNIRSVVNILSDADTANFTVILEGGWVEDSLLMHARAHGLITGVLASIDTRIPIVVSCTSMLKGFAELVGMNECRFTNHQLIDQLRRGASRELVLYGDWGSTRPREDGFGQAPLPRIDYAGDEAWYVARNKEEQWGYRRAAEVMVNSGIWDGTLGVWGEEMIQATAINPAFAIDTPQKNVAARVNIHLHRQAHYGENIRGMNLDEAWVDYKYERLIPLIPV